MNHIKYSTASITILADLQTPVELYLKIRDMYPQSAMLESSDFHANENSKSFIGIEPLASISINSGVSSITIDNNRIENKLKKSYGISEALIDFTNRIEVVGENSALCGLFGYTSFDSVKYTENIPVETIHDTLNDAPDLMYILYKYIISFNHFKNELTIVELIKDKENSKIDEILSIIQSKNYASHNFKPIGNEYSTITDDEYREYVRRGVAHCKRGDVFQIVLSRRFVQRFEGDDFKVYRALRSINPSPYLFYFDFGGFRIFGSSPETHCKISDGKASIDPIAGTTRRTGDSIKDKELCEALVADPKENAEHVMLVDLARNDLSRNAHSVNVEFYKEPQYYSHVIHLVSRVSGIIDKGIPYSKVFFDTFPAGTLSGAPKVRAMQLISEIEQHNRGAYGGCIGFIGLDGTLNQAITIRSFVSRNNELWFQAGAGIIAKSIPENELQEVNNKLGALKKAINMASKLNN